MNTYSKIGLGLFHKLAATGRIELTTEYVVFHNADNKFNLIVGEGSLSYSSVRRRNLKGLLRFKAYLADASSPRRVSSCSLILRVIG
jgi:hypothetical protein